MCSTSAFAAEKDAAAAAPVEGAKAAPADAGNAAATPAQAVEPTPEVDMEKVVDDCKKGLSALGKGNIKGLDSLSDDRRGALLMRQAAVDALTCLAIAENNPKFCEALPKDAKNNCVEQSKLIGRLKGVKKENLKSEILYMACANDMPVADCEKIRDAVAAGDAAKCAGLSKIDPNFCKAVATGDASTCGDLADAQMRDVCAAYALEEEKHCPSESQDCRNLTTFMAAARKKGLAGVGDLDAGAVATAEGREACAGVLAELEKSCDAQ